MAYRDPSHGDPAEPDVVGFGSERPPRRPWVTRALTAAAAAVIIAVAITHLGNHGRKPVKPVAQPDRVVVTQDARHLLGVTANWDLFARGFNYLVRIQPASGEVTTTMVPPLESNNPQVALIVGPHEVVVHSYDDVPGYVVHDGDPASQLIGPLAADSPGPLLPGPEPSQAWVMVGGPGHEALSLADLTGRLTGRLTRTSIRLPPGGPLPATAISDGRGYVLLLTNANRIYDAGPTWDHAVPAQIVAVGPTRWLSLACRRDRHCRNVVTDAASGAQRTLPGPPLQNSAFAWPTLGVISPDGAMAGVPVFYTSSTGGGVTLELVNLQTGASRPVRVLMNPAPGYQSMAWSPDSRWLFLTTAGGQLVAVNASTGRPASLGIPLPAVEQVAIRDGPG